MKRIIIVGATSGIGYEVAKMYVEKGWRVGAAGRREAALQEFRSLAPDQIEVEPLDVTATDAAEKLQQLIEKLGGMDLFLLSSGVGNQNVSLHPEIEINTAKTNVEGFIRMVTCAFDYFKAQGSGHLAVISSIAGTKGLGSAPAYSATKRFQNTYIDALAQLNHLEKLNIRFTDIRPGFVATALLKDRKYPLLMQTDHVARCIVKALDKKKRVAVIDFRYAILVFFWRLIPRWLWEILPVRNDK
nr:SDR family NAD(P)-dependent oxidoreductase [uncultured Bacteroides sp.]